MTVAVSDGRTQITATAGQTLFNFNFEISDEDQLVVKRTLASDGSVVELALTTDYTVSGVGNENGGSITYAAGAVEDDVFTMYRDADIARLTDFQDGGDFRPSDINAALDLIFFIMQQLDRDILRSARLTDEDEGATQTLPNKSARASKFFGWDANGNPVAASGTSADLGPVTAFINTLLDDADADTALATLTALKDVLSNVGDIVYEGASGPAALRLNDATKVLGSNGTIPALVERDPLPPGFIVGMKFGGLSTATVTVTAGRCRNNSNDANVVLAASIAKNMAVDFAEGTGNGGRAVALPSAGVFHIFAITKDADGTVDVMGDTSASGANVPSGWTVERRLFSMTTGSSTLRDMRHRDGDRFEMDVYRNVQVSATTTGQTVTLTAIPTGIEVDAILNLNISGGGAGRGVIVTPLDITDTAPSATDSPGVHARVGNPDSGDITTSDGGQIRVKTNTSAQVRVRATTACTVEINTEGWIDRRGQDG